MTGRILPPSFDNTLRGHPLGLWLFVPIVVMKGAIGLGTILNGGEAARSADGVPLDSFGAAGAEAFVAVFALWGLSQLLFAALGALALARYRAMIPLMYIVLLAEHVARKLILVALPIPRTGAPPGLYINLALLAVMSVGLVLSLQRRGDRLSAQGGDSQEASR